MSVPTTPSERLGTFTGVVQGKGRVTSIQSGFCVFQLTSRLSSLQHFPPKSRLYFTHVSVVPHPFRLSTQGRSGRRWGFWWTEKGRTNLGFNLIYNWLFLSYDGPDFFPRLTVPLSSQGPVS